MPVFPLLTHTVTFSAGTEYAALEHYVDIATTPADNLQHALTVTRNLATANAAGWRLIGMKLELDLGTGTMEEIPPALIGGDVRISESLETYADQIDFTILGRTYSPFVSAVMRGRRQLRVTGRLGTHGGNLQERVLFDGYIHQCGFLSEPPGVRVQGYDGATAVISKRLVWTEEPGSRKTRKEIFQDICSTYSITLGNQDWGSRDGGIIVKPISEGGDVEVLEWLREFVKPIGRVLYFSGGALHVIRPRTASTADRILYSWDMAPGMDVGLPAVTNANVVTATGVVYEYAQVELGKRTATKTETTTASYTPVQATSKQSSADGSVSAVTQNQTAADREVSKRVTVDTYLDGSIVRREVTVWGWYAPRTAKSKQAVTTGTVSYNDENDAYLFPDGTYRSQEVETYQKVARRIEEYTYGSYPADGYLTDALLLYYGFGRDIAIAGSIASLNPSALDSFRACYIEHDGSSFATATETYSESTLAAYSRYGFAVNDEGKVFQTSLWQYVRGITGTSPAVGAEAVWVGSYPWPVQDVGAAVGLFEFKSSDAGASSGTTLPSQFRYGAVVGPSVIPLSGVQIGDFATRELAKQDAMDVRQTVKDAVQIALNGEHYYYIQDEGAELTEELRVLAWEELREQGHWPVSFGMVEDLSLHKGSTVEIIRPEIGLTAAAAKKFLVWSVDRSFNLAAGRFSMRIGAKYYPPELDTE